ncbi:MAG: hypothetical protein V7607_3232 [Solirubrobacteraceae bacterium]
MPPRGRPPKPVRSVPASWGVAAEAYTGPVRALTPSYPAWVDGRRRRVRFLAATRDWYMSAARDPVSRRWTDRQREELRLIVAPLYDRVLRGAGSEARTELRLQVDGLGLSAIGRRRLGAAPPPPPPDPFGRPPLDPEHVARVHAAARSIAEATVDPGERWRLISAELDAMSLDAPTRRRLEWKAFHAPIGRALNNRAIGGAKLTTKTFGVIGSPPKTASVYRVRAVDLDHPAEP